MMKVFGGCSAVDHAVRRFRPNIVVSGCPAWAEFGWVGKQIKIGGVVMRVLEPTVRCPATQVTTIALG
jgi:uncharacterized protein YcbX